MMRTITMYGPSGSPFKFTYDEPECVRDMVPRDKPMSRRDTFAAAAMNALLSRKDSLDFAPVEQTARMMADRLIAELDKP